MKNNIVIKVIMNRYTPWVISLLGVLAAVMSLFFHLDENRMEWKFDFEERVRNVSIHLAKNIELNVKTIEDLASLFFHEKDVSRDSFRIFSESIIKTAPLLKKVFLIEAVPAAEREYFEGRLAAESAATDCITLVSAGGGRIKAGSAPLYYPVYFAAPSDTAENFAGVDFSSEKSNSELIRLAGINKKVAAVIPFSSTFSRETPFFIYVTSVGYDLGGGPGVSRGRRSGFIVGIFSFNEMIADVLGKYSAPGFNVTVRDPLLTENGLLYGVPITDAALGTECRINLFGRELVVAGQAATDFLGGLKPQQALFTFLFAVARIFLMAAVILLLQYYAKRTEREVALRTTELVEANDRLKSEITAHREDEDALTKTSARIVNIVENMNDAFATFDLQMRFTYVNLQAEKLFRFNRTDLIGKVFWEVIPEVKKLRFYDEYQKLIAGKNSVEFKEFYPPSGVWVEVRAYISSEGISAHFRDITQRVSREAEKARAEEELRKLSQAVEQSPAVVMITDTAGYIEYVNPKFEELTGYTLEEVRGKKSNILKSGETTKDEYRELWNTIVSGGEWRGEFHNRKKNGELYWELASISPIKNAKSEITHFLAVKEDVTARKKFESELRASEEKFYMISSMAADGMILLDPEGKISFWNHAAEVIFGYSKEEAFGASLHELLAPPQFRESISKGLAEFKKTGKGVIIGNVIEMPARKKNGSVTTVELSVAAITIKGQWHAVGIVRDIAARKRAEQELQQAKELAEQANRYKSVFLANMSHEIRTPLNGIIGFSDMMMRTRLNEEQFDYAKIIKSSSTSLLELVNDILDFSKIESGQVQLESVHFDIEQIVVEVAELVKFKLKDKPVEIICSVEERLGELPLKGDPLRFRQILSNLMNNASKFTEKGEIAIYVELLEETPDKARVGVKLRDTGIGIPIDKLGDIFEEFKQADSSVTRKYGGTGLGLSICRRLIRAMNGEIWAESEMGLGSVFNFFIWLGKSEHMESPPVPKNCLSGLRLLVIDDNPESLRILETSLASRGASVTCTDSPGLAACELHGAVLRSEAYDLVISDVDIPEIDGQEIIKAIRSLNPPAGLTPVLAFSGSTGQDSRKLLDSGFSAFLFKPAHTSRLIHTILSALAEEKETPAPKKGPAPAVTAAAPEALKPSGKCRVLLVEDHPVNQKLAVILMESEGISVDVAANGVEALERFTKSLNPGTEGYDLIFMDIMMPDMDGITASRKIRSVESGGENSSPARRAVPIVAVTANVVQGDREKCITAGMDDYISKPIKKENLMEMIKKWVFSRETGS